MTLHDLIDGYARDNDISAGYTQQLHLAVTRFGKFLGRDATLDDLQDKQVNDWLAHLLKSGLSRRTVRSKRGHLLVLWRSAYVEGLVDVAPRKLRRVDCPRLIPEASEYEEAQRLLEECRQLPGVFRRSKVPRAAFWSAFVLIIWEAGLRLGDVLALRPKDITASGMLGIIQQKTGWPLITQLSPECLTEIKATFPSGRQRIFGDALSRGQIFRQFREITARAGFNGGTKRLRKSGATAVEKACKGAAPAYLGHRTPATAYAHYVDPRIATRDRPSPPPLTPPPTAA